MSEKLGVRFESYSPLAIGTLANPFLVYSRLLSDAPLYWDDNLFAWVMSKHADCRQVLQHHATFTRDRRKLGRPVPVESMSIQSLDPPDQIALRQAVHSAIQQINVAVICSKALDEMHRQLLLQSAGDPFDFMAQASSHAAMEFAGCLVGMPKLPADLYASIFLGLTRSMDSALDPSRHDEGVRATQLLNNLIVQAKATAPTGSLIYELHSKLGTADVPAPYVRNTIAACFNAAYSTAYSSMGSFLVLAFEHPGLAKRIVDTENLQVGLAELLRFTSPAQSTRRYAAYDTVVGGMTIRQNDPIVTLMAAANRDPQVFERPNELILNRAPNPHLSFGAGPHYCVGARPAQEFLKRFIARLATWEDHLTMVGPPIWLDTFTLRCLDRLPMRVLGSFSEVV